MKTPKIERTDGGPDRYECDNCQHVWPFERLENIADIGERLDAGGVVPAGECPVCGALCYPSDPQPEQLALPRGPFRVTRDGPARWKIVNAAGGDERLGYATKGAAHEVAQIMNRAERIAS